jgi:uracil-DNA glycosylase
MSERRTSYRSLGSLQRDNRRCRACLEAGFPIVPPPVFEGHPGQRAILVGQSPGAREGADGRPWRGRAGQTLRRWLEMDEDEFYGTFYCCSVTRCYPGKSPGGRGDRVPAPRELDLCRFWLDRELELLQPGLVVTVGGLSARRLLGLRRLTDRVGSCLPFGDATAIPLPHPSGASGWLNLPENRALVEHAVALVHEELARVGRGAAAAPHRR